MLLLDRRRELGTGPATHAFIVGLSSYPNLAPDDTRQAPSRLGLRQRRSSVPSAEAFRTWLTDRYHNPAAPLATCRALLSPAPDGGGQLSESMAPATLENFLSAAAEWRADAATHRDNVTIFYFAGHALQTTRENIVLFLQEFGEPIGGLRRQSVDVSTLTAGMSPTPAHPDIARTQLFIVESDRLPPSLVPDLIGTSTTPVWDVELGGVDDRSTALIYAASQDPAFELKTPSVFMQILLTALDGAAADWIGESEGGNLQWAVTTTSLVSALNGLAETANVETGAEITFSVGGLLRPTPLHYLHEPPLVDVQLSIDREDRDDIRVRLSDGEGRQIETSSTEMARGHHRYKVAAGIYSVEVTAANGQRVSRIREALPPSSHWKIKLSN